MRNFGKIQRLLLSEFSSKIHPNIPRLLNTKTNYNSVLFCNVHTSPRLCSESPKNDSQVLVYEGPLKRRVKRVKLLSLTSSMIGLAVMPVVLIDLSQANILLAAGSGMIMSAFLSTPLLLHWITKSYVTELHYDSQTQLFTAKTYNLLSQEKELQFSASDVKVPDLPGMLSSFEVRGRPLFVDSRMVNDIDAYSHMMGYDKPIDFKFPDLESKVDGKAS